MDFAKRLRDGSRSTRAVFAGALCAVLLLAAWPALADDSASPGATPPPPAPKPSSALTLQSADGKYSLTFGFTAQLLWQWNEKDYQYENKEKPLNPHPLYSDVFSFRRVRPTLSGSLFSRDLTYYYQANFTPGKIEQLDYYLNYALLPNVQFRVGQCKIPFTRYRINSYKIGLPVGLKARPQ